MSASPPKERDYEVFLCHNSEDKPAVRKLRDALQIRSVCTWFDEDQLIPGRSWQEALELAIQSIGAAAICVGRSGFGPWQNSEMRAYIDEFVHKQSGVIPVLLPGAAQKPDLPPFLRAFTWVDLRGGRSDKGLHRLICGIRGLKPGETPLFRPQTDTEQTIDPIGEEVADQIVTATAMQSTDRATEMFIAEELLRAICKQLNSGKEPFHSLCRHLIRELNDSKADEREMSLESLKKALDLKLSDVMRELQHWLGACETLEQADALRRLVDGVAAAGMDATSMETMRKDLEAGHLHVPIETNIQLCEVIFTALYKEAATWTPARHIDPAICFIESPSVRPQARSRDILRSLVETYFKDHIHPEVGENPSDYAQRLDKFVRIGLPKVLKIERDDGTPWFVLFLEKAAEVKETLKSLPELWAGIVKVECSDSCDRVICDIYELRTRLMKMYEKLDELQGKSSKGAGS